MHHSNLDSLSCRLNTVIKRGVGSVVNLGT